MYGFGNFRYINILRNKKQLSSSKNSFRVCVFTFFLIYVVTLPFNFDMNNFDKYTRLVVFINRLRFWFYNIGCFCWYFLLRLISITLFSIPGSATIYHFLVSIVPYLIFFVSYYYLYGKMRQSKNITSKGIAALLLIVGCLICAVCVVLVSMLSFGVKRNWLNDFDDNSGYNLVLQLVIVFFTAMALAFGGSKEKKIGWIEIQKALSSMYYVLCIMYSLFQR